MKKKVMVLLAAMLVLTSFSVGVLSKGLIEKIEAELRGDFTIFVDGEKQQFKDINGNKVDPILYNGTTYLPIRAIGELMNKKVYWYQDEKKIELVDEAKEESLVTDADVIIDGGDKKVKDEKPLENKKNNQATIDLDEAKEIVLKKAGLKENDVVFTKAKLDYDDGRLYYEIDFKTDEKRYDTEVDAVDGDVTEWEVEEKKNPNNNAAGKQVTLDEAKKIALNKAGLKEKDVVFEETKLDNDDGKQVYDIEFRHERVEYSFEIDAADGRIIEWEKDND